MSGIFFLNYIIYIVGISLKTFSLDAVYKLQAEGGIKAFYRGISFIWNKYDLFKKKLERVEEGLRKSMLYYYLRFIMLILKKETSRYIYTRCPTKNVL